MVTAMADSKDVVAGLEAGGDEYLTKPVDHAALAARVRSMLRIKRLHDTAEALADGSQGVERLAGAARRRAGRASSSASAACGASSRRSWPS